MTPELRLDRAERLLMLIVKAGYRARQNSRAQDEKINILIDSQIKTDEQISRNSRAQDEKIRLLIDSQAKTDEQISRDSRAQDEKIRLLIDSQAKTDEQISRLEAAQERTDTVMVELAEEHKATERSLKAFLDGLQKGQNGNRRLDT